MSTEKLEEMLSSGLVAFGTTFLEFLYIEASLPTPEAQIEMIEYMVDNQHATPHQLCEAASKIYSKYPSETEQSEEAAE